MFKITCFNRVCIWFIFLFKFTLVQVTLKCTRETIQLYNVTIYWFIFDWFQCQTDNESWEAIALAFVHSLPLSCDTPHWLCYFFCRKYVFFFLFYLTGEEYKHSVVDGRGEAERHFGKTMMPEQGNHPVYQVYVSWYPWFVHCYYCQ